MRRKSGHGNIQRLPSGRWRVRVRSVDGKLLGGVYGTEAEAESVRRGLVAELHAANAAPTGSMTLQTWSERFFIDREREGFRSVENERSVWRNRIESHPISSLPLQSVTRDAVKAWLADTREQPVMRKLRNGRVVATMKRLEISSARRIRAVLRGCLEAAFERGLIRENPASAIVIRAPSGAPRWTYLSRAEVDLVLTHDQIPARFRLIYIVAIFTGLRRGELWALRWRDITLDGDRPQIFVQGSHAGPTKSGKVRYVPLLPQAHAALQRLKELARDASPDALVFVTSKGHRRHEMDRAGWGRNGPHPGYRIIIGLKRAVSFHAFRHTCASGLLQGYWGAPWRLEDVKEMLGHASINVTQRYAHLDVERLHARVTQMRVANDTASEEARKHTGTDPVRHSSIRMDGTREITSESTRRVTSVSFALARALLESVEHGIAVSPTVDALVASVRGTDLEAIADQVTGALRIRRAIDLAEHVLEREGASLEERRVEGD